MDMMHRTRKHIYFKRGLSEVVAVLILVTVSVLLAATVALYVSGITSSRMKGAVEENVRFYKTHAWVNESDLCVAAFKLYNLGGKSVTIESVVVRGTEMDWPDVYWNRTSSLVFRDMNETTWANVTGTSFTLDNRNYVRATGNIFVRSGEMILVYMKTPSKRGDPSIIHRGNIGTPILLAVSTPNACHTIELIVEAAS
jgi:hypothetical protein